LALPKKPAAPTSFDFASLPEFDQALAALQNEE
jgi:hypothetical protein